MGERPAMCCVTMYEVCACTYGLLDVADGVCSNARTGARYEVGGVDRGMIPSRDRMLSSHGCCVRIHEVSWRVLRDHVICMICACTYGLLDAADACRNRHFHDYMQVSLMWPMPAVTVT